MCDPAWRPATPTANKVEDRALKIDPGPVHWPYMPIYLDNTSHPANRKVALAKSKQTHIHSFGLDLVGKSNNGHFAPFNWSN